MRSQIYQKLPSENCCRNGVVFSLDHSDPEMNFVSPCLSVGVCLNYDVMKI